MKKRKRPAPPLPEKGTAKAAAELTEYEVEFLAFYLSGSPRFNATQAAMHAGDTNEQARKHSWKVLRRPHVAAALQHWRENRLRLADESLERFMREVLAGAFSNIADLATWDEHGVQLIPSDLCDERALSAVAEVKTTARGSSLKLVPKAEYLRILGQLKGYITKDGTDDSDEARKRALAELLESMQNRKPSIARPRNS